MIKKLIHFYNLLVTGSITIFSFTTASSNQDLIFPIVITPLAIYFAKELFRPLKKVNKRLLKTKPETNSDTQHDLPIDTITISASESGDVIDPEILTDTEVKDIDRRLFLKLIGSAGLTAFVFSLFTDKAHGAFFGSMPGPGIIGIKDSSGNIIDPAEKLPTHGYKIAQVDDTSDPTYAYYGFVDKTGAWYLQRETLTGGSAGQYLYSKGASNFATAWTNRATPTPSYNTFDIIF